VRKNNISVQYGERLAVVGSCPELGEWNEARAFPLEYINANTWQGGLALDQSAGKQIKYVVIRENAGAEPALARYLGRVSAWHPPRTGRLVSIVASPRHRFEMRACASGGIGVPSI
jgi:hypothetical protein